MQRAADQVYRALGGDQPLTFGLVSGQNCGQTARRQVVAKLGSRAPVTLPGALDTCGEMMPCQCCQRHRVADQYAVQPVIRRHYVEQPVHRGLLEPGRARRMHPVRPPRR